MRWLETRVPPPIVMLLLGMAALVATLRLPGLSFNLPFQAFIGATVALAGLMLNLLPKLTFRRVGTTVNPLAPGATTRLITSGIYRHTRNPMYVGHALILLGWTLYLGNVGAVAAVPAFVLFISRFQIRPEERILAARFENDYAAFCRQVPRWL